MESLDFKVALAVALIGFITPYLPDKSSWKAKVSLLMFALIGIYSLYNGFSLKDSIFIFLFVFFLPFSLGNWIKLGCNKVKSRKSNNGSNGNSTNR